MPLETLLSTKLHIPAARVNLVRRPRLIAHLAEGLRLGHRLTLVSASPGFGKTTLMQEWIAATERRVAWLSLDEGDNDPLRFLRYVLAALNQADERIGSALIQPSPSASPAELLIALINDLAQTDTSLLLVLDDYHLIRASSVHELLVFLLTHQPPGLHVAIGTREDPPLPLARLRSRDQLTEIREAALRFRPDEAAAFLNQTMNLGLTDDVVARLALRAEGWVTALQLAGLALRLPTQAYNPEGKLRAGAGAAEQGLQANADQFVTALAGDDRYIVDYLMAEVMEREPEPMRSFLRQTAILDRVTAPLCDVLTGRNDSQAILEHLEAANVFLTPLDNRREWYRYHVLFAEVLRLTLTTPERVELCQKAAGWFEACGLGELALPYNRYVAETAGRPRPAPPRASVQPLVEPLSEREIEVLHLIAEGYSNADIARQLFITVGTVKRHINNIYGKLDAGSRTQAVARARGLGLIS